jgi:hypothetical protein
MDHVTVSGTAIAVALTPPALAVSRKLCHVSPLIQSHELRFTTLNADGLRFTIGDGNVRELSACKASALGATAGEFVFAGVADGNHESAPL